MIPGPNEEKIVCYTSSEETAIVGRRQRGLTSPYVNLCTVYSSEYDVWCAAGREDWVHVHPARWHLFVPGLDEEIHHPMGCQIMGRRLSGPETSIYDICCICICMVSGSVSNFQFTSSVHSFWSPTDGSLSVFRKPNHIEKKMFPKKKRTKKK